MISSIVVNYRTPADLIAFCESYDGSESDELFIVNVSPTRVDTEVAQKWADKLNGWVIQFEDNVGYARAVNRAASLSEGDVLAVFNADVQLRPGALHRCANALRDHDDWGVLGPLQVDHLGRCTHPGIFGTQEKPEWRPGGWKAPVQPPWREIREDAVTVMGSAYFVKKHVWIELTACPLYLRADPDTEGAFLQTPLYYEETWCSYHCSAHGYKVVFYGLEEIIHEWHGSIVANKADAWASRQFHDSQILFRRACDIHSIPHD